ncbi:MAG: [FeFe] hydrogenase H-cluster radical SAM maturase HydE [Eubacterium sp.]|nr:[FeFe] hydrogenase H-cluster radical SAM maturase HydE [Eubacterium sp.]
MEGKKRKAGIGNSKIRELAKQLYLNQTLPDKGLRELLEETDKEALDLLYGYARQACQLHYGKKIYVRGLIEFTNYCRNNCYYCGIRRENQKVQRYRLSKEDIYACVKEGYALGFRTFVLQGGEDIGYTAENIGEIICWVKQKYPGCAITLSFGEWDRDVYQYWFDCGADRYLLRHETADEEHYRRLHPVGMSLLKRMECLSQLKEIGYQTGAGFMVGSPGQTLEALVADLRYLQTLKPHMAGIGPFIPQKDTPFAKETAGTLSMTLKLLSIVRLMFPKILLPATTALGTIHPQGRELGILAGANVVMPNLSPANVRLKYQLYDNKICTGEEAAQGKNQLEERVRSIGYELCMERGDSKV